MPIVTGADLDDLPEPLLRALCESFQLEVRYHHDQHAVTLRVTVRADRKGPSVVVLVVTPPRTA